LGEKVLLLSSAATTVLHRKKAKSGEALRKELKRKRDSITIKKIRQRLGGG